MINNCINEIKTDCVNPLYPNKNCVCFCVDDNYCKVLSVALCSLKQHYDTKLDLIIIHNNISLNNMNLLSSIFNDDSLIKIRFYNGSNYLNNKKLYEKAHINKTSYLRFSILDILKKYNLVLYCDCDVIFNSNPSELFKIKFKKEYAAVVRDSVMCSWNRMNDSYGRYSKKYNENIIKLNNVDDYFNNGVILFNIKNNLNYNISAKYLFDISLTRKWTWQDQDILNYVYKDNVIYLNFKWNLMVHEDCKAEDLLEQNLEVNLKEKFFKDRSNPEIIHYAGHYLPIYGENVYLAKLYWETAKNSPYYKDLILELNRNKKRGFSLEKLLKKNKRLFSFIKTLRARLK